MNVCVYACVFLVLYFMYVCPGFYFICLFSNERERERKGVVGRTWEGLEEGNPDETTLYGENVFSKGIFPGSIQLIFA